MSVSKFSKGINPLYRLKKPGTFDVGVAARLPDAYKKFWNEWKEQQPEPVHYVHEPGKWKRNPETGEVIPIQNIPIPLLFPKESNQGLWGGEGVVEGFQKRNPTKRRVPHFWFPVLHRTVIYSEILNKHWSTVVTMRAMNLIHKHYGLDHYILQTPACDLQGQLALKLKRKMLVALYDKDLYPDNPQKKEEIYNTYKKYLDQYTREEIEWYGLDMFEAMKKQMQLEEEQNKPVPLKVLYRSQLLEKLEEAGKEGVEAMLEEHGISEKKSWIARVNPFGFKKRETVTES